jgi:hypothetical protein
MCTRLYVYSIDLEPRLYVYPSLCVPVSMCTHVFLLVSAKHVYVYPSLCVPVSKCTRLYVYSIDLDPRLYVYSLNLDTRL